MYLTNARSLSLWLISCWENRSKTGKQLGRPTFASFCHKKYQWTSMSCRVLSSSWKWHVEISHGFSMTKGTIWRNPKWLVITNNGCDTKSSNQQWLWNCDCTIDCGGTAYVFCWASFQQRVSLTPIQSHSPKRNFQADLRAFVNGLSDLSIVDPGTFLLQRFLTDELDALLGHQWVCFICFEAIGCYWLWSQR